MAEGAKDSGSIVKIFPEMFFLAEIPGITFLIPLGIVGYPLITGTSHPEHQCMNSAG